MDLAENSKSKRLLNLMNNGVSFCIPAYNNPEYLKKSIESILSQGFRPIEIIVVDDNSPNDLTGLIEDFQENSDVDVRWIFRRNETNLGPYWNMKVGIEIATNPYLVMMPHDDWFIDNDFINSAIEIMATNDSVHVVLANSQLENSDLTYFNSVSSDDWMFVDGVEFLTSNLYFDLHPAYSAVVFDREELFRLGFLDFWLTPKKSKQSEVIPDEGFISLALLASQGRVAISGKVVSIRGNPANSYSKSQEWGEKSGVGVFYPNYRLYRYFRKEGDLRLAIFYLRLCVSYYPIYTLKIRYLRAMERKEVAAVLLLANLCCSTMRRMRLSLKYRAGKFRSTDGLSSKWNMLN
jgi:glycosyltransferase involved in cell wall biosynthesis